MSKIRKYHNFTLIEVLFAMALLGIFFNMALMFYYNGRKASMRYMDKAAQVRSVSTIAKSWRNFAHAIQAPSKVEADKITLKDRVIAAVKDDQLLFTTPEGQKAFALPKGFTASFCRETNSNEPDILVLKLQSKGSKGQVLKDKFIRITAHIERGGK